MVDVKEVQGRADLKRFVTFPERLYRAHPYYVPKLVGEEQKALRPDRNPAFEYCEARYWMAYRDGAPVEYLEVRAEIAKGGRSRTVPMNHAARGAVLDAIEAAAQVNNGSSPDSPLFVSRKHQRMTPRAVQHMIEESRGEKGWITPHTFRHTFATNILRATGNIRITQKLLGHASINTTTIYTHPGLQDLSAAVAAISSGAR